MNFDSNRAWQQAAAAIRANREVLFALTGVFFLLPFLAFALLFPQPAPPAGASEQVMMQYAMTYYAQTMPVAVPMALVQAAGTLALLALMTDRSRPTVGEAIRRGFMALPSYIGAQLLVGFALGLAVLAIVSVGAMLSPVGGAVLAVAASGALFLYLAVRFSLTAPAVAVEGLRSPLAALRRSWALTSGNTLRILVFFALLLLVFAIVLTITSALAGTLFALALPPRPAEIALAVVSSALQSGMGLMLVAALAATHAQLVEEEAEAF